MAGNFALSFSLNFLCISQEPLVELQNSKTKAAMYILVKKVAAIIWIHQILNLFDHEQYIFIFFLCHDLIALLDALFQTFDRC